MKIAFGGLIGCGKSTAILELKTCFPEKYESVDEIVEDNPFLTRFYDDPAKWGFATQMFFLTTRTRLYNNADVSAKNVLFDRTPYEDSVFAVVQYALGNFTEKEMNLYRAIYHGIDEILEPPDVYVLLEVEPAVALERIKKRGREFEKEIPLEYLEELERNYVAFIDRMKKKCLVVRANYNSHIELNDLIAFVEEHAGEKGVLVFGY